LAGTAALYARRALTLAHEGRPVPRWRQSCFYGGLATILITYISPIGALSDELLAVHMVEHLFMVDIGALLIVLGLTGHLIAPLLRIPLLNRLRVLAHPAVALPLWILNFYAWHLPVLYEAAVRHPGVHALEHTMFVVFGVNMWMCLFGPLPMPEWFGNAAKLVYIVLIRMAGMVLGNVFTWSASIFYPLYRSGEAAWHVSPRADQVYAGGIMMLECSLLTLGLFCWLFLRAASEIDERQKLLDYASAHGIQLGTERAARAVAAGRGAWLRDRLEGGASANDAQDGDHEAPPAEPSAAGTQIAETFNRT
jgi:cytochrome c oxidase assembly factor CtaG